jgi:hypothetical protein
MNRILRPIACFLLAFAVPMITVSAATAPGPDVSFVYGPAGNDYLTGSTMRFTVYYNTTSPITVNMAGGVPYIYVTVGTRTKKAICQGQYTDPNAVYFTYTVQAGDYTATGVVLDNTIHLNGGTIVDQDGNTAGTALQDIASSTQAPNIAAVNVVPPTATTLGATNVTDVSATVKGAAVSGSSQCIGGIQYGTIPDLSTGATNVQIATIPGGKHHVPLSTNLTGLTPNTAYYYRTGVEEVDNGQIVAGSIQSFTTAPSGPEVSFVYGPTGYDYLTGDDMRFTVYYNTTSPITVNRAHGAVPYINVRVGNRTEKAYCQGQYTGYPNAIYFIYTALAGDYTATGVVLDNTIHLNGGTIKDQNGSNCGTALINIASSTDAPNIAMVNVLQPVVKTHAATDVQNTSAILNGTVTSGSTDAAVSFEYSTVAGLTSAVHTVTATPSTVPASNGYPEAPFSFSLTGLLPSTTYYFRADAVNSDPPIQKGRILSFTTGAALPVYPGGGSQSLSICENAPAKSVDALLSTTYTISGATLYYTVTSAPSHGALSGLPSQVTSTTNTYNPTGTTYTPTGGYAGSDSFIIQVSDGTHTATTTVTVTVNPLPAVPPISGMSSVCPNASVQLSDGTLGGTWSVSDATIASIDANGKLTGVNPGTVNVTYTVTSSTCSATATSTVIVNVPPAQPGAFTASQSTVTYGQTGVVYTVPNDPAVTYIWSYSGNGATINGTGNSVTLDYSSTATGGILSVTAQGTCGASAARQITITLTAPAITFTPGTLPAAAIGTAYNQVISGAGGTAPYSNFKVSSGSLPAGLTLGTDGTLSGTPTEGGSFTFKISATDASTGTGPYTGSQSYTLQVSAPTLVFTPSALTATVGAAYSQAITAAGGTAPYSNYTVSSGSLPAGLTLGADGTLSGTPTEGGSFTFKISATDASTGTGPYTGSQSITLQVSAPTLVFTPSALTATVGAAYSQAITAAGGTAPYGNYTVSSGSLPAGLTLGTDGTLSGTPTEGGSFTFKISATDASTGTGPYTGSQSYTLQVSAPTLVFTPSALTATVGAVYSQVITASGGTAPYSNYTVSSGNLPAGLTLGADGTLSGTPTEGGSFTFKISATDASTGASAPYTGSQSIALVVGPPVITLAPPLLPAATVGAAYSQVITASGGTTPYAHYTTVAGTLPAGITLGTDGTLSGIPTEGGNFTFTISVTDASSGAGPYTVSQAYSLTVNTPGITLSPTSLPDGQYGQSYQAVTFGVSGGTAPYGGFTVTNGSLPGGMTLSSAGILSGMPGAVGDFTFTVTAADASGGSGPYTGSATYTLHVSQAVLTITAADESKNYGQANPVLALSYSGFINGDDASSLTVQPTVTVSSISASGVGTYPIVASGAQDPNYTIVYKNGILTVNPASVLVTAVNQSRNFGTPDPTLTYYFSGFVNGEDSTVLTAQPSISTTALQSSVPGQYPISLSGGSAANYIFVYQDGVLTINPSLINTITFGTPPAKTYGDPDFTISATANSGLPVRFVSADNSIATITGDASGNWTVHIVSAGQVTIEAFQDGNADYGAATEVDQSLAINKADQAIEFVAPPSTAETGNAPLALSASASSGLPVIFTVSDPTLATISGNTVIFTGTGTVTITATQPGNNDYNTATPVSYTITIYNGSAFHSGIAVFPNPAHGTLYVHFSEDYLITKYVLFSINGQIVKGQDNVTNSANVIPINVSDLASGYYLLRVVCIRNHDLAYPVFKVLIQ